MNKLFGFFKAVLGFFHINQKEEAVETVKERRCVVVFVLNSEFFEPCEHLRVLGACEEVESAGYNHRFRKVRGHIRHGIEILIIGRRVNVLQAFTAGKLLNHYVCNGNAQNECVKIVYTAVKESGTELDGKFAESQSFAELVGDGCGSYQRGKVSACRVAGNEDIIQIEVVFFGICINPANALGNILNALGIDVIGSKGVVGIDDEKTGVRHLESVSATEAFVADYPTATVNVEEDGIFFIRVFFVVIDVEFGDIGFGVRKNYIGFDGYFRIIEHIASAVFENVVEIKYFTE